jgi:ribonuclease HI
MDVPTPSGDIFSTGAAFVVYDPGDTHAPYRATMVKPSGPGIFNENHRAELVAILASLTDDACMDENPHAVHIYTDSLASIHAIHNAIFRPQRVHRKLHSDLVGEIARLIINRAAVGSHTHMHKVKSHVGIEGNEIADSTAKAAAQLAATAHAFGEWDYAGLRETVPPYWIATVPTTDANPERPHTARLLRNPRKDVGPHIAMRQLDLFPPTTVYCKGLAAEHDIVSMRHRDLAWGPDITDGQKRTLIRTITGQILNFKLISMYTAGRVPPLCPLCNAPDSTSHIVCGGCAHPDMRSRVIKRHDNAVRITLSALLKGSLGVHAIMADVRVEDAVEPEFDNLVHGTTVVPRILPAHLLAALRTRIAHALARVGDQSHISGMRTESQALIEVDLEICRPLLSKFGTAGESLAGLRDRLDIQNITLSPDIAVFIGGTYTFKRKLATRGHSWDDDRFDAYCGERRILIVELGYVREGFASTKQHEKRAQHALLAHLLQDLGWSVEYHTITLGVAGTIYKDALATTACLGLSAVAVSCVIRKWVHMTLNHTHGLVTCRRQLDNHHIN